MAIKSTRGARPARTTAVTRTTKAPQAAAKKPAATKKPAVAKTAAAKKPALAKKTTAKKPAVAKTAAAAKKPGAATASRARAKSAPQGRPSRPKRQKRQPGVPPGFASVTPHLIVSPCAEAMAFYTKAFGAERMSVLPGPGGLIVHAAMRINGQAIMLADEQPPTPGRPEARRTPRRAGATTCGVMLYVADVDAWHDRAVDAGASSLMAPSDMFWGDRYAQLEDPFGHVWAIATYQRAVSEAEMIAAMVIMSEGAPASADS